MITCSGLKREENGIITCPFRERCERYLISPSHAIFAEAPLQWPVDGTPSCEHFLPRARVA